MIARPTVAAGFGFVFVVVVSGCVHGSGAWDEKALSYLLSVQQEDGGFSEAGSEGDYVTTLWVGIALQAQPSPSSALDRADAFLRLRASHPPGTTLSDSNRASLTLLYAAWAGADARDFGGQDLVASVEAHQNATGAVGNLPNENLIGALALASAVGVESETAWAACGWLDALVWESRTVSHDGWYVATAIQAVAACREAVDGELVDEGLGLLETFRHDAGGFSAREGGPADASTTANAVQALRAVGNEPGSEWESLIVGLQQESGAVAFRADVAAPLIKTTAEVLLAQRSGLAPS